MKLSTILLTCVLLLAASNSDSCGKEAPNARENPDATETAKRQQAEAERLKAEQDAQARLEAQAQAQWKRDGGSDE